MKGLPSFVDRKVSESKEGIIWEQDIDPAILWRVYETETWVNAGVNEIVKWVIGDGIHIIPSPDLPKGKKPDEEQKKKLEKFTRKPNGDDTIEDLFEDITKDVVVVGDGYLEKARIKGQPTVMGAIFPLDTLRIRIKTDTDGNVTDYLQRKSLSRDISEDDDKPIPAKDVVHFKLNARGKTIFGRSKIKATMLPVMTDLFAQTWNRVFFENFASPRRVWKMPETLSQEQFDANRAMMTQFKGAENAHRDMILWGDVTSETIDVASKDMDFLDQRKFNRGEILAVLGVPEALLGIVEGGSLGGNIVESLVMKFRRGTVFPIRRKILGKFNSEITRKELEVTDWVLAIKDPDPPADLDQARTETLYVDSGIKDIDESRAVIGLPPKKTTSPAPDDDEEEGEEEEKQEPGELLDEPASDLDVKPVPGIPNLDPSVNKISRGIMKTLRVWRERVLTRFDRITKSEDIQKQDLDPDIFKADIVESEMNNEMTAGLRTALAVSSRDAAAKGGVGVDQAIAQSRTLVATRAQNFSTPFTEQFGAGLIDTINNSVNRGDPIPEVRNEIESYFDQPKTFSVAETLDGEGNVIRKAHERTLGPRQYSQLVARTEAGSVAAQSSVASFQAAGIEQLRWKVARTRVDQKICQPQANEIFRTSQVVANNPIPAHPNCRCSWAPAPNTTVTAQVSEVPSP